MSTRYEIELRLEDYDRDDIQAVLKNCGMDKSWTSDDREEDDAFVMICPPTLTQAVWICEALAIEQVRFEFIPHY